MNLHILGIKEIQNELKISYSTARKYYKDIKDTYNTPIVTRQHLIQYLNLM